MGRLLSHLVNQVAVDQFVALSVEESLISQAVDLLARKTFAFDPQEGGSALITKGDIAILRFLQALEQVEEDLWRQYAELGGTQDNEFTGLTGGNAAYSQALQLLDGDMPQYIHDNTDDEISHARFLENYLESKGVGSADLSECTPRLF